MVEGTVLDEFGVDTAVDAAIDVSVGWVSGGEDEDEDEDDGLGWTGPDRLLTRT